MNDLVTRVLRITPFVFLGSVACTLCILTMLGASDTPYLFVDKTNLFAIIVAFALLPISASFELEDPLDFFLGVVLSTTFGIAVAAFVLFDTHEFVVSMALITSFSAFAFVGMIPWIICSMVYFLFFVLGRGLNAAYRRLQKKKRKVSPAW